VIAALGLHAALFAAFVLFLPAPGVTAAAWAGLYLLSVGVLLVLPHTPLARVDAISWIAVAAWAAFFAIFFATAAFALDALHGAHRPKAEVARHLGGLELWFVLCPGLVALAPARALAATLRARRSAAT
jgi:hypothetical protein